MKGLSKEYVMKFNSQRGEKSKLLSLQRICMLYII
jgi:hypothetical protein